MNVDNQKINAALLLALEQSVMKKEGKDDKVRKFDETIDLVINIRDVDIKTPGNRIEQEVLLPHGIKGNKSKKTVCFIVKDDMELAVKKKGYPIINPDMLSTLQKKPNKDKKTIVKKYDYFVARGDLMRDLAKVLARFLGQQGKMPKPQPKGFGIIRPNENIDNYCDQLDRIVKITMKKQLLIQVKIGKKSQDAKDLMENIDTIVSFVEGKLANGMNNIRSIFLKTTMGKPVKVEEGKKGRR